MITNDNASPCGFRMVLKFHRTSKVTKITNMEGLGASSFGKYKSISMDILHLETQMHILRSEETRLYSQEVASPAFSVPSLPVCRELPSFLSPAPTLCSFSSVLQPHGPQIPPRLIPQLCTFCSFSFKYSSAAPSSPSQSQIQDRKSVV